MIKLDKFVAGRRTQINIICFLMSALVYSNAFAHHGAVTNSILYVTDEIVELEGQMEEVFWRNPHTRGRLKVVNDAGEETVYEIELGPGPRTMEGRYGLSAEDFLGTVKVAGYKSRRKQTEFGALNVLLPNGKEIMAGNSPGLRWGSERVAAMPTVADPARVAEERQTASSIFRSWGIQRGEWVEPEEDLSKDWLTEHGREVNSAYNIITDNRELSECRQGMPDAMFDPLPMQIVDLGERITIEVLEYNTLRTIYMNTASTPEPVSSATGHSTGRWVGETLIVTTTHIDWPYWSEWGLPQSEQSTIVERFSVSDEENILNISVTVLDPIMYTRPFSVDRTRIWTPG